MFAHEHSNITVLKGKKNKHGGWLFEVLFGVKFIFGQLVKY